MSITNNQDSAQHASFGQKIQEKSHQNILSCYQCMKCAGGCPMNHAMEHCNYEILRMVQMGEADTVLRSNTPWLCLSCKTCATRCPNGIDTSKVMDTLKAEAVAAGIPLSEKRTAIFYDSFLKMVGWFGRLYDFGMVGMYKTRTGAFFADMDLGKEMMKRGKMPFLPHRIQRVDEMKKIMRRAKEKRQ